MSSLPKTRRRAPGGVSLSAEERRGHALRDLFAVNATHPLSQPFRAALRDLADDHGDTSGASRMPVTGAGRSRG